MGAPSPGPAAPRRAARRALAIASLALLAACEFGEKVVPPGVERPVVHAVLNPAAATGVVLVERTLTGRVDTREDSLGNPSDPIRAAGGVPITGARVVVSDARGNFVVAEEQRLLTQPTGTGVYRFANLAIPEPPPRPGGAPRAGVALVPGGRYQLRVETPDGTVVTAETTIPGTPAIPGPESFAAMQFNRDRDTLALSWPAVPGARSYALQVETPYGTFYLFTDSASYRLTGALRNLFAERLPRVFQAGFTQYVYVAAVDSNYFDYYRSTNSPFTGSGLINRLNGGIGLFGGYVPIMARAIFVRADNVDPLDGRYLARANNGTELLRLWVDTREGGIAEVTGSYRLPTEDQYGVLGTLDGARLRLRVIQRNDSRFVFRTLEGTVNGDTLSLTVSGAVTPDDPRTRVFVRERTIGPTP
jgi:hypothetical protein